VQDRPKDNLQPHLESAVRNPASEYRRAFGTTSIELSKVFIQDITLFVSVSGFMDYCCVQYNNPVSQYNNFGRIARRRQYLPVRSTLRPRECKYHSFQLGF